MQQSLAQAPETQVRSYMDWWSLAGVDTLCVDAPVDWMQEPVAVEAPSPVSPPQRQAHISTPPPAAIASETAASWPTDLSAFQEAVGSNPAMPGCNYSARRARPVGTANARVMVIGDCPEQEELNAGELGQAAAGKLLAAMMQAIGLNTGDYYQAVLAHSQPATGALPFADHANLAQFGRHHIELVRPAQILLLGNEVCEAFLGLNLMEARGRLHDFNHSGRKWTAFVTFHPRTLLARPALKAQAWQDLQMLANKD